MLDGNTERRRHKRFLTARKSRMIVDGEWRDCTIRDVSVGGAAIKVDIPPPSGSRIVLYIEEVGTMACLVLRHDNEGVGVQFEPELTDPVLIADILSFHANPALNPLAVQP